MCSVKIVSCYVFNNIIIFNGFLIKFLHSVCYSPVAKSHSLDGVPGVCG